MRELIRQATSTVVAGAVVGGLFAALTPSKAGAQTETSEGDVAQNQSEGGEADEVHPPPELRQNRRRLAINEKGMLVLLGWSAANIGVGAFGWASAERERAKYFHQMNLAWNGVNALIGGLGYAQAVSEDPAGLSRVETIEKTRAMQQILLLNAGLDVAYMAGGAWLRARGAGDDDARLSGYGDSLIVQGGFLFAFDLVLWGLHQSAISDFKATVRPMATSGPGAVVSVDF